MTRCSRAAARAAMTDDEFWTDVAASLNDDPVEPDPDDDQPDAPDVAIADVACETCGSWGPCGYDTDGRPMIHATEVDDR